MPLQSTLQMPAPRAATMFRLLTPNDYRSMPWKNGAGRTTEIAVHPAGAALDAFAWRVSIADVERDGPFSRFPGIDRTIVLLDGAGMRLRSGASDIELTTRFVPHDFSGDDAIECTLVAGPCAISMRCSGAAAREAASPSFAPAAEFGPRVPSPCVRGGGSARVHGSRASPRIGWPRVMRCSSTRDGVERAG